MKLPTPSWLTLKQALAWLVDQDVPDLDAKAALQLAFRNSDIRTRGNFGSPTSQVDLYGDDWECAVVNWNLYNFPDRRRYPEATTDVDNIHVSRDDLFKWLYAEAPKPKPINQTASSNRRGRKTKFDWESFYIEIAVRADSINGLPESQADLVGDMASWCEENWEEPPGDSSLKSKISPIYNHPNKRRESQ